MKKIILSLMIIVLMVSVISAEITIIQQPKKVYNLGDVMSTPIKIITYVDINNFFSARILCNGKETEIYKEYVVMTAGQEKQINPTIQMIPNLIGDSKGTCKIKFSIEENYSITDEFRVSDMITITLKTEKSEFNPGEEIAIEGQAVKENGGSVSGFVEMIPTEEITAEKIKISGIVGNGYFKINFTLPKDTKAGQPFLKFDVFEKDSSGAITNKGYANQNIIIRQVPTSLEIIFENSTVSPGTNLRVSAVLHDQTGEKISSEVILSVKDKNNVIILQEEKNTGEILEYPIKYKEPPAEWRVYGVSNKITNEVLFKIPEKKEASIEIINKTLIITNTGNVFYNDSVEIKIGYSFFEVNATLDIDESKKYTLSAPEGNYVIEANANGKNILSQSIMLTGKTINVRETSEIGMFFSRYPVVWIFIIIILAFTSLLFFKKKGNKNFFGYFPNFSKKKFENSPERIIKRNSLMEVKNIAELSLSAEGDKQDASIVCFKIKNFEDIKSEIEGTTNENIQRIVEESERKKAYIYQNEGNIFFIFAPLMTRTYKNEKSAVELAQKIKEILTHHN